MTKGWKEGKAWKGSLGNVHIGNNTTEYTIHLKDHVKSKLIFCDF